MRLPHVVVVVLLVLVSGVVGATAAPHARVQLATDPNGRFTIRFPSDWQVVKAQDGPSTVAGLGPAPPGQFHANVNVVVEELAAPVSAATYARMARPRMARAFQGFTVLREGPATIARRQAYYRYYTWTRSPGVVLYQVQAYIVLARRAFILTGTTLSTPDRVRRDFPVISQIFETFTPTAK